MTKIAVYTAIFGGKDCLLDPFNFKRDSNIDYYCFTDCDSQLSDTYDIRIAQARFENSTLNSRYYKIFGDALLFDYDYVIWHDGNIQIDHAKVYDLVKSSFGYFLSTFTHPHRSCFYEEARVCITRNKESPLNILKQVISYSRLGLPSNSGLFETGIVVKNNRLESEGFYFDWWNHILRHSNRDQLSLCFLAWKKQARIGILPGSGTNNAYSVYSPHDIFVRRRGNKYLKFMFNKFISSITPKSST